MSFVLGMVVALLGGGTAMSAEDTKAQAAQASAENAYANLPVPNLGVRQDDLHPQYSELETMVWVQAPQIRGCVLDLFCYEWSNLEYLGFRNLEKGALELRHRARKDPNVILVTTVTPEPGAVELVARAEVDKERAAEGRLPDELPGPNLCFRVKRADECFSAFPYPFPDFIARSFIFTDRGMTFLSETGRLRNTAVPLEDPRNNPSWVQVYVAARSKGRTGPAGKTWYNTSPDRFVVPMIGVVSHDGKWLTALACASPERDRMTQAWQQCFHNNPVWAPADAPPEARRWRVKVYIMPNDPSALLKRFADDFPDAPNLTNQRTTPQ